jgi:cell division protein FtsQ
VSRSSPKFTSWGARGDERPNPTGGARGGVNATRGWRIAGGVVLGAVVLGLMAWGALMSPLLEVHDIHVVGASTLSNREILVLAEVRVGENLVRLSTQDVERRLTASPWIAQATVSRSFPNTLRIGIVERRAVGWGRDEGGPFVVAGDAVVLDRLEGRPRLPSIGRYPGRTLESGALVPEPHAALRVLESFSAGLLRSVSAADVDGSTGVLLRLGADGGEVLYGPATSLRRKNEALAAILHWVEERDLTIRYIDVRAPESPVLRPGRGAERTFGPQPGA